MASTSNDRSPSHSQCSAFGTCGTSASTSSNLAVCTAVVYDRSDVSRIPPVAVHQSQASFRSFSNRTFTPPQISSIEWVEIVEPRTKEHMYANLTTGECAWDAPLGVKIRKTHHNQWWELYDQNTGRFYYYNTTTQKTVWNRPQNCDIIPLAKLQTLKQNTEVRRSSRKEAAGVGGGMSGQLCSASTLHARIIHGAGGMPPIYDEPNDSPTDPQLTCQPVQLSPSESASLSSNSQKSARSGHTLETTSVSCQTQTSPQVSPRFYRKVHKNKTSSSVSCQTALPSSSQHQRRHHYKTAGVRSRSRSRRNARVGSDKSQESLSAAATTVAFKSGSTEIERASSDSCSINVGCSVLSPGSVDAEATADVVSWSALNDDGHAPVDVMQLSSVTESNSEFQNDDHCCAADAATARPDRHQAAVNRAGDQSRRPDVEEFRYDDVPVPTYSSNKPPEPPSSSKTRAKDRTAKVSSVATTAAADSHRSPSLDEVRSSVACRSSSCYKDATGGSSNSSSGALRKSPLLLRQSFRPAVEHSATFGKITRQRSFDTGSSKSSVAAAASATTSRFCTSASKGGAAAGGGVGVGFKHQQRYAADAGEGPGVAQRRYTGTGAGIGAVHALGQNCEVRQAFVTSVATVAGNPKIWKATDPSSSKQPPAVNFGSLTPSSAAVVALPKEGCRSPVWKSHDSGIKSCDSAIRGEDSSSVASGDSPRLYDSGQSHPSTNSSVTKSPKLVAKATISSALPPVPSSDVARLKLLTCFQKQQPAAGSADSALPPSGGGGVRASSSVAPFNRPYRLLTQHLTYSQFHQQFILGDVDGNLDDGDLNSSSSEASQHDDDEELFADDEEGGPATPNSQSSQDLLTCLSDELSIKSTISSSTPLFTAPSTVDSKWPPPEPVPLSDQPSPYSPVYDLPDFPPGGQGVAAATGVGGAAYVCERCAVEGTYSRRRLQSSLESRSSSSQRSASTKDAASSAVMTTTKPSPCSCSDDASVRHLPLLTNKPLFNPSSFVVPQPSALRETEMEMYAHENLNRHKKGLFRKRQSIQSMLSWSRNEIKKSLIMTTDKTIKKEACEVFKRVQAYMGDRKVRKAGVTPDQLALDICVRGWAKPAFRDEIYIQLCKQTTENPGADSLRRGWELMCICLSFFPPSLQFASYLDSYIARYADPVLNLPEVPLSHYAQCCAKRLERVIKNGAKRGLRKPSVDEVEQARLQIFHPSMFGNTLDEIMSIQRERFPKRRLPWIQTALSELVLKLNGAQTEGIFRVPGDIDEVNALKVRVDRWLLPPLNDPHIPASLLKCWYRELAEPLVPDHLYQDCVDAADDPLRACETLDRLPPLNRLVFAYLIRFLQIIVRDENVQYTKMDASNLAMVIAPNCLRCQSDDPSVIFENTRKEMTFVRTLMEHLDTSFMDGVL